jgi:hypothetical protein
MQETGWMMLSYLCGTHWRCSSEQKCTPKRRKRRVGCSFFQSKEPSLRQPASFLLNKPSGLQFQVRFRVYLPVTICILTDLCIMNSDFRGGESPPSLEQGNTHSTSQSHSRVTSLVVRTLRCGLQSPSTSEETPVRFRGRPYCFWSLPKPAVF